MNEVIYQLECVKTYLEFISETKDKHAGFAAEVLETCISQLNNINRDD